MIVANFIETVERENEISKNNAMLIKNLLEISHGKRTSVPAPRAFASAGG